MMSKFKIGLAVCAACAMVSAGPAYAAGTTRSAQALPLLAASVGSVPYSPGVENQWRCVPVTDEALKLKKKNVQVDTAGRVVLSPKGQPYKCNAPGSGYKLGASNRFPFEIVLGLLGVGGVLVALAGSGGSDSPG